MTDDDTGNANSGQFGSRVLKRTPLTLAIPVAVHKFLVDAARRRKMKPEDLAVGLIGAVLTRGNVEEMMGRWGGYIDAGQRPFHHGPYAKHEKPNQVEQTKDRGTSENSAQAAEEV
jgi:hypothetical protein